MIVLKNINTGHCKCEVLKNISVCFEKGKITSIIGKNGCGKSTLLKTASRHLKPFSGKVFLNGNDIYAMDSREFAKEVSYLPQEINTPYMSVHELVSYGRYPYLSFPKKMNSIDKHIVEKAMMDTGVYNFKNKSVNKLSGGERRKVYIAMVLAQDTDIIFLDEPLTYLDISQQLEILELLKKLKILGKTIIMVIHDISEALRVSDYVCLLDEGNVVMYDTPENLYRSSEIQRVFNVFVKRIEMDSKSMYTFCL